MALLRDYIGETLGRWWGNPLLHHIRWLKPLALTPALIGMAVAGGALAVLTLLAWIIGWRLPAALLMVLSLGAVLLPLILAPVVSANRTARQMGQARLDPRQLTDLDPLEVAWGLALRTLWRLRWPVIIGLACTPALLIGLLRLNLSEFAAWRDSAQTLGTAASAAEAARYLVNGRIPYLRVVVGALSAPLLTWCLLPLLASLGVLAALRLADPSLSTLAALLGGMLALGITGAAWGFLSRTPHLAGALEIVRLVLLGGLVAGIGWLTDRLNRHNAALLGAAGGIAPTRY